jgi:sugar-specific transcriptional regulator TrmB
MAEWDILGITKNEFKIYQTLLKSGASTITSLADKAQLDERSAYDYIERLINKGLVGQIIKNNKRMFLSLNPNMLSYYIDEQKKAFEADFKEIEGIAKKGSNKLYLNIISQKADLMRIIKKIEKVCDVFIGANCEDVVDNPNFKYFLKSSKHKIVHLEKSNNSLLNTSASVVVIFAEYLFLIYSVPEESGFFIKDKDFASNMREYFK